MREILVVALEEELSGADIYCGIGRRSGYNLSSFLENRGPYPLPKKVINYGTCGSFIHGLRGLHKITTFSDSEEDQGDGLGLKLLTQEKFVTKIVPGYDLVDCEAFYLKQICDKREIEFECYKYITDEVGKNTKQDWVNGMKEGEACYREYLTKVMSKSITK
ncbi:MAG: hypothetical protein HOJ35_01185 [Bdellovibrionales bacterium]|jgi:hypothetical protein|nr:hypothetical protein [Bdellovibrionales bacterium]